ncbi:MAG: hypothetical protein ACI9Y7_002564, partial [Dokdonia sp.]
LLLGIQKRKNTTQPKEITVREVMLSRKHKTTHFYSVIQRNHSSINHNSFINHHSSIIIHQSSIINH